jgi:hypothetical protein
MTGVYARICPRAANPVAPAAVAATAATSKMVKPVAVNFPTTAGSRIKVFIPSRSRCPAWRPQTGEPSREPFSPIT